MLDIFVTDIADARVIIDDYFVREWEGEMITRDVDVYARLQYGEDICHIFGTDTIESMPDWDSDQYAAKIVRKLFIPRSVGHRNIGSGPVLCHPEVSESSGSRFRAEEPRNDRNLGCYVDFSQKEKNLLKWMETIEKKNNETPPNLSFASLAAESADSQTFSGEELGQIQNYSIFTEANIPDISSTEIRKIIPEYATIHARFEESPKFIIPGLSKKISQYILKEKIYLKKPEKKPRILVHVCCGPDVTMPIIELRDDYDIICFWYDPNIQPKAEYDKRYDAFVRICEIEHIPYIKGAYDVGNFFTRIK